MTRGDLLSQLKRNGFQFRFFDRHRDQTKPVRLGAGDILPAELDQSRFLHRHTGMKESAGRHLPEAAPQYFRHADLSVHCRDDEIVRVHEGETPSETVTVHLGNGHFGKVPDRFKHDRGWTELIPIRRWPLAEGAQVIQVQARTVARPIAFCDHSIDLAIGTNLFQSAHDISDQLSVYCIALVWPVKNDPVNAGATDLFQNDRRQFLIHESPSFLLLCLHTFRLLSETGEHVVMHWELHCIAPQVAAEDDVNWQASKAKV